MLPMYQAESKMLGICMGHQVRQHPSRRSPCRSPAAALTACTLRRKPPVTLQQLCCGRCRRWVCVEGIAGNASCWADSAPLCGCPQLNAVALWSLEDCWSYLRKHSLKYHPLHDIGYPSIGDSSSTNRGS